MNFDQSKTRHLSLLLRLYACLSPSNPNQIESPPFPPNQWLCRHDNQVELFNLLVIDHPLLKNQGKNWKISFWKRVISAIEKAFLEIEEIQEEEIDERILEYYISLQSSTIEPSLEANLKATEILTYFYGGSKDCTSWRRINLLENKLSIGNGTTGLKSWGASVCLANYLILHPEILDQVAILELGSGTGLLGIVAHQLNPANAVYLTDCNPLVLERLKQNINLNPTPFGQENLMVMPLDWNSDSHDSYQNRLTLTPQPQLILAADVVYDPSLILGLVLTIKNALELSMAINSKETSKNANVALICVTARDPTTWQLFITVCQEEHLKIDLVDLDEMLNDDKINPKGILIPNNNLDQQPNGQFKLIKLTL
ncbi:hypothetical protein O181_040065 [Austropuccinia psidii MF-1]|uniref:FAM86 N-terminal domain-containing protein n=1 Tax=Austropuccinia psidii MF-1 TaxID=1389203 RepID=A0A9Q3HFR9_9BASI|nr:hypothetical protein [Austropuccinia psidii MF-1]